MANEKLITLNNLDRFKKKYDTHLENGGVEVGVAKQLKNVSEESGSLQDAPFVFQATGTDNNTTETPTAPIAKHLQLRGNSVAFNQLFASDTASETINGITFTNNGDGSWTLSGTASATAWKSISANPITTINNHKVIVKGNYGINGVYVSLLQGTTFYDGGNGFIGTYNLGTSYPVIGVQNGTILSTPVKVYPQLFDITLLGKDYTSILAFNRDYPLPYYSYNAGALLDCNSQALETTGFNQWDEEWENSIIQYDKSQSNFGQNISGYPNNIRSKNYIPVIAGQTYILYGSSPSVSAIVFCYDGNKNPIIVGANGYISSTGSSFQVPDNCHFIRFYFSSPYGNTYKNDICLYLEWDGSRTGYEPYVKHTYQLPQMNKPYSAGNVANTLDSDGTETDYVEQADLSTLSWTYSSTRQYWETNSLQSTIKKPSSNGTIANILCSNKSKNTADNVYLGQDGIGVSTGGTIYYHSTDSSNHPVGTLLYELATPTTEQTDKTFTENIIVDDFGTMRFVPVGTESASNPIVPQGNQFFYPADYVLLIDDLNSYVDGAVSNLALKGDLQSGEPQTLEELLDYTNERTSKLTKNTLSSYNSIYSASSMSLDIRFNNQEYGFATLDITFVKNATTQPRGIYVSWSTENSTFWGALPHLTTDYTFSCSAVCSKVGGTSWILANANILRSGNEIILVITGNTDFTAEETYRCQFIIPIY